MGDYLKFATTPSKKFFQGTVGMMASGLMRIMQTMTGRCWILAHTLTVATTCMDVSFCSLIMTKPNCYVVTSSNLTSYYCSTHILKQVNKWCQAIARPCMALRAQVSANRPPIFYHLL